MRKNIIFFSGSDTYGIERAIARWKNAFESKYGSINIDRYHLENTDLYSQIRDQLLMTGLFAEKRLFIFSWGREKTSKSDFWEILETMSEMIPEDHFLMFHNIGIKEEKLINWLEKNADHRKYNDTYSRDLWEERFGDIDGRIIDRVLQIYGNAEKNKEEEKKNPYVSHDIGNTLEIISSLDEKDRTQQNIDELIHTDWWGKMFDLIDLISAIKIQKSIDLLRNISLTMKSRELLPLLIWLTRSGVYIKYLEHIWLEPSQITGVIKVHPFVLKKNLASPISYQQISRFYQELLEINRAYKSGKWLQDTELWSIFWIELAIMGLKK